MPRFWIGIASWLFCASTFASAPLVLKIYFDADRTGHSESALAIEQGVRVAFSEVGNQLNGIPVEFVALDHRGNVKRSKANIQRALNDPATIALVAGLHSPPLIKYRDFINQSSLLTLVPWAAATPITRGTPSENNYIFRLSVDDSKVGKILVDYAVEQQCRHPHLVLENTGWGKSNFKAMMKALPMELDSQTDTSWFDWGIENSDARIIVRKALSAGADCLLMVANTREGKAIVEAISEVGERLPVYSHWGITGGQFSRIVPYNVREQAPLRFIQSCFNFYSSTLTEYQAQVFERAKAIYPDSFASLNIEAPAGFVHGYDLTKLLIAAAQNVQFVSDTITNRRTLKTALENMDMPVEGLLKTYHQPFELPSSTNLDAHEALSASDYCMAYYDNNNAVKLL
ncbi:hypothetical protein TW81_12100 [Vibrio galatheae]|uniref:Leucine-binding protein domain-containing protein n=1 Tax=Vibrio galatheae TaxID=579748 RepID=A0A0F4NLL9_9VIBR|nr:ABC transporter substrate-binding protein [Vibrio galatheae]KJY82936.1 hypothetical protein TW81_12100 [Vibrio galatheae]